MKSVEDAVVAAFGTIFERGPVEAGSRPAPDLHP
jgi:hypothetical protein